MDVLLLDAERRWAVPVVRSLGRHGVRVLCASTERLAAASASRFSAGRVRCPPADHPDFAGWLDRTIDARGTGMVLGLAEPTLFRLLDLRDRIGGRAVLPYPDRAAFEAVADKAVSTELAREAGLAVPFTVAPRTVDEGLRLLRGFRYPCVVKPRTSSGARGFTVLHGPDEAHRYAAVHAEHGPALIQEMILDGTAVGVSFLYDGEGRRRATFAHRRLREFPATGGNCTLAESISPPEVAEGAAAMLERAGWRGVAMVEFRFDPRTGRTLFLEVNPRFWGTVGLAVAAGVDFPWLLLEAFRGRDFEAPRYAEGVRGRFLAAEVIRWVLQGGSPGWQRSGTNGDRVHDFVASRSDPWPFVAMLAGDAFRSVRRGGVASIRRQGRR